MLGKGQSFNLIDPCWQTRHNWRAGEVRNTEWFITSPAQVIDVVSPIRKARQLTDVNTL
jgi:hypothetical protein